MAPLEGATPHILPQGVQLRALVIVSLLFSACHDGKSLSQELQATCQNRPQLAADSSRLVAADLHVRTPLPHQVIVVDRLGAWLNGQRLSDPDIFEPERVKRLLQEAQRRDGQTSPDQAGEAALALAIYADAPAAGLVSLLPVLLQLGYARVALLARSAQAAAPTSPRQQQLLAELESKDPASAAMFLFQSIEDAITYCPDLSQMFQALAGADPGQRCELFARGLAEAQLGYCIVDMETVMAGVRLGFTARHSVSYRSFKLDPNAAAIQVGAKDSWQPLASKVFAAKGDSLWLKPRASDDKAGKMVPNEDAKPVPSTTAH